MTEDRLLSRVFVLAFVANVLHSLAFFMYLHLPGFLTRLGADELVIGIVFGTMAASAIAMRPFVGGLMDRRGRHVLARWGSVLHVLVTLAYLGVDDLGPWLYLVRIVHGVAEAMLFSVLFTIAADVVPARRRTEGMAWFGVSGLLPMSLAGLLGDAILAHADYPTLFVTTTVAAGLGGLCSWVLPDSRPPAEHDAPPQRSFLVSVSQPPLRPLWVMGFGFALAIASYFTFFKTFVEHTGISSMGMFFSIYSLAAIGLRLGLGWIPDRVGPRRALVPSMLAAVGGIVVLALVRSEAGVVVAAVLCGAGHAFVFPILSAMVVTRAQAAERGAALSMFTALFDLGLLVGSPLLGAVLERTDYATMFLAAAGLAAVLGVVFLVWDRRIAPHG